MPGKPGPLPGLVIRYDYLWYSEDLKNENKGKKYRPCAVVMPASGTKDAPVKARVCGITHTEPRPPSEGILIPPKVKQSLGLDEEPSWIIISEYNEVDWLDPGIRTVPDTGQWIYGTLPRAMVTQIVQAILERNRTQQLASIKRAEGSIRPT